MKKRDNIDLRNILPFGGRFLLVDRIVSYEDGKKIVTEKLVRRNEWFFKGHFPGNPVMPGHLIAESMAQTCALYFGKSAGEKAGGIFYLVSSKARFYKAVKPGNKLTLTVYPVKILSGAGIFKAEARVKNNIAAKGTFILASRGKK